MTPRPFSRLSRAAAALLLGAFAILSAIPAQGRQLSAVSAAPVSQFTWNPSNPYAGQPVQFADRSSNAPTSWSWIFGDGATSTVQNPSHVFASGGSYRVKLTSSNASGHSLGEHTITVGGSTVGGSARTPRSVTGRETAPIAPFDSVFGCNYYASPAGTGDGSSIQAPFQVADFWSVASAGKTLCLLDGVYKDAGDMIAPPAGISGVTGAPITIKAIYDGGVLITGTASRQPVLLTSNDWFVLEGINACCSSGTVVSLNHSNHDVIRRVAAWDAAEGNYDVFGVHNGDHNLLEDVAGWGIARKVYESSQNGNSTTIRRAWGRWEGSHVVGPKMVYSLAYNNFDMLVENSIGTWSGEKMKPSYVLLGYDGQPWTGSGAGTYSNYSVEEPYGVFSNDGLSGDKNARARLFGSIAYSTKNDVFKADRLVFVTSIDSVDIKDTAAVFASDGNYPGKYSFALYGLTSRTANGGETNVLAQNLTSLNANSLGNLIGEGWQQANIFQSEDLTTLAASESAYPGSQGANLCREYVDGSLTDRPLWPWPMARRISEAMVQSGRTPVDITQQIVDLLGPIPSGCRSTDFLLPVVGHIEESGAPVFQTDLHIYNPSSLNTRARLVFEPKGTNLSYRINLEIPSGQTVNVQDTVRSVFGLDTAIGSVVLQSDAIGEASLRANTRSFAASGAGTMGLAVTSSLIPGLPASSPVFVTGLAATSTFRSTLGAVNTTPDSQVFKIVLRSQTGTELSVSSAQTLYPGSSVQWPMSSLFDRASGSGLLVEFQPQDGTNAPVAYGILVDETSGDSAFHPASAPLSGLYLPGVGNEPRESGVFATDLYVSNTSDTALSVQATFLDHDGSNANQAPATLRLEGHQTLRLTDALHTLFGLSSGFGAIKLSTLDGSSSLVAAARASAPSPTTGGTVGHQINGVTSENLRTFGSLLGLEQDASYGAAVAFLNPADSSASVTLELRDPEGNIVATRTQDLPASRYFQRNLSALIPAVSFPSGTAMTLSFRSTAPIFAFASVTDRRTGDPAFFSSAP